jgi:hypothetical protein
MSFFFGWRNLSVPVAINHRERAVRQFDARRQTQLDRNAIRGERELRGLHKLINHVCGHCRVQDTEAKQTQTQMLHRFNSLAP